MIDTLIYVMVVMIDTTVVNNGSDKAFDEAADRKFNIEMLKQASHEAAHNVRRKNTYQIKILDLYRKED